MSPVPASGGSRMSHAHKDDLHVGPYRLEKTLGKGQTAILYFIIPKLTALLTLHSLILALSQTLKTNISLPSPLACVTATTSRAHSSFSSSISVSV
ncbi:hypothetical protein ElyMa_002182000 [Elysia marginata]|uniref:Uncharacterized protein n=1 Tax=Elysia marginata TaxID=1093978 RepID=A0AAV4FPF8_9GAST|nr:hypothetical protein ElyMa_002182000 [Elysia marginata]